MSYTQDLINGMYDTAMAPSIQEALETLLRTQQDGDTVNEVFTRILCSENPDHSVTVELKGFTGELTIFDGEGVQIRKRVFRLALAIVC